MFGVAKYPIGKWIGAGSPHSSADHHSGASQVGWSRQWGFPGGEQPTKGDEEKASLLGSNLQRRGEY
eukprot:526910-Prorocentrum_lima.AAC.1